jgi:hypothetical protein
MNGKQVSILFAAALVLPACAASRNMLGMGDAAPPPSQISVQTNNPLALPPDLSLRQPGSAPVASTASTAKAPPLAEDDALVAEPPVAAAPAAPRQDVYAEYGISKTKPDGTPKDATQLQKELKAAVIKRKQQQNPNYGTIFNMGSVFSDG